MPYILSPMIDLDLPGLWGEGNAYERSTIYDIHAQDVKLPPVNYCAHTLKPHSLPHVDLASHIIPGGAHLEDYFNPLRQRCFFGLVTVLKLSASQWREVGGSPGTKLWRVSKEEVLQALEDLGGTTALPDRLFLTASDAPINKYGFHDPNYVLVLEPESANMLVSNPNFVAYGTSWKSSDFEPGSRERPVHKILLKQAVLYECLKLDHVPAGEYFLSAFPIALRGASESPVLPVLYSKAELSEAL